MSNGAGWTGKGVTLPEGTLLRLRYGGAMHTGQIVGGKWHVAGCVCATPSGAANATAARGKARYNGWLYWQVLRPGDREWIDLSSLRWPGQLG
jgi:hypothetical protein